VGGVNVMKRRKDDTMRASTRLWVLSILATLVLTSCGSEAAPEDEGPGEHGEPPDSASVQEKLDWLAESDLTAEERRAFLIEKAAQDGPVVLYGSLNESLMLDWQARLDAEFPELEIQVLRLQEGFERIRAESEAGQPVASVHDADPQGMAAFLTEGEELLAAYRSPALDGLDLAPGVEHSENLYTVHSAQPMVAVYNTDLLSEDEVPDTLQELAESDIAWGRSRFGARWFAAMTEALGEEEANRLIDLFDAQNPQVFDSNSGMREAVIVGQIPLGVDTQLSGVVLAKEEGAPLEYHIINPPFTDVGSVAILSDAPNPYGAVLIYDWILEADGGQQNFIGDTLGVRSDMDYEIEGFEAFVTEAVGYTPELLLDSGQFDELWEDRFVR
jgi:ABC-type Fe3+ transport system substrate-binding protein